jgi:hypothetical protein
VVSRLRGGHLDNNPYPYENDKRASDLDGFFGLTTQATEYGYDIRIMEYKEFV